MADTNPTEAIEDAFDAFKKHWIVFVIAGFILVAWALGSDANPAMAGARSRAAAKWPIIGPYFFKNTPLAAPAATN
jgi:hypothetical protein